MTPAGAEEEHALKIAADLGVSVLPISTPFAVGRVNCYLIDAYPLILVDTGPNQATALQELEDMTRGAGHQFSEIGTLLLTHHHLDHAGLAAVIAARTRASTWCIGAAADYLQAFAVNQSADDDFAAELMLRHGVSGPVVAALRAVANVVRGFGGSVTVDYRLDEGAVIEAGSRTLRVLPRPGHSSTDTIYVDDAGRYAFVGDHLLRHISSNALVTSLAGGTETRRKSLLEYRGSLRATRELELDFVLAGHGPPIVDYQALIDRRLNDQDRRAEVLLGLLHERRRASAHELAQQIWGPKAVTQAYLTLSETLGHLDLLTDAGVVHEDDRSSVVYFEPSR